MQLGERSADIRDEGRQVTNLDWIAGMMSALAIAALLWAAVALA